MEKQLGKLGIQPGVWQSNIDPLTGQEMTMQGKMDQMRAVLIKTGHLKLTETKSALGDGYKGEIIEVGDGQKIDE